MIAVNPTNPDKLIAVAKDYNLGAHFQCTLDTGTNVWAGAYRSSDGGKTWTNILIPPLPPTSTFQCSSDPVVAYDSAGTAYFSGLGSTAGGQTRGIWVAKSFDDGATWPTISIPFSGAASTIDKEWISTDPRSGGDIYLAWTHAAFHIARSWSDDGVTWSEAAIGDITVPPDNPDCVVLPGGHVDTFDACTQLGAQPVISKTGTYYLAWATYKPTPDILVARSNDGGVTLAGQALIRHATRLDQPVSGFRVETVPSMAVDLRDAPQGGNLYVVWQDVTAGVPPSPDIYVSRSTDGGVSWSATPILITDDAAGTALQFFPSVAVGPDGKVHAVWYDQRNDPDTADGDDLLDVYYSVSSDGGLTWSPNLRVTSATPPTTVPFNAKNSYNQHGFHFIGDYIGLVVGSDGVAHPVWADTRNDRAGTDNDAEVYTARVLP